MVAVALFLDPEFWVRLLGISFLNLLLSGDNALVIALAVRKLAKRQRMLGQIGGALGAVALRLAFVAVVSVLLRVPFVQFIGGVVLVWIAVKLVQPVTEGESSGRQGSSMWEAIWIIVVADVTMSLDNVLAIAAAAKGEFTLVMFGVGLSLPLVVWGAGLLARLMNRYIWVVWLGGGLLGYVAAEMALGDPLIDGWLREAARPLHYPLAFAVAVAVTLLGWWLTPGTRRKVPENV